MVAPRLYCTVKEAAKMLGVSASTVERRIADGSLPVWQPGGENTKRLIPIQALTRLARSPGDGSDTSDKQAQAAGPTRRKGPAPRWQAALNDPDLN